MSFDIERVISELLVYGQVSIQSRGPHAPELETIWADVTPIRGHDVLSRPSYETVAPSIVKALDNLLVLVRSAPKAGAR